MKYDGKSIMALYGKVANLFRPVPPPLFGSEIIPEDTPEKIAKEPDQLIQDLDRLDRELRRHGIINRRW